jgi:hypothetical protein
MAHELFVSYASKDKLIADAICAELEAQGVRCWIAPRDVKPGTKWPNVIVNAIKTCKVMVLVFSSNSNRSQQVAKEVDCAINHEKIIIPFRIEDIEPTGSMEYYLGDVHWLDALTPPVESHINTLSKNVHSILDSTSSEGEMAGERKTIRQPRASFFVTFLSSLFQARRERLVFGDALSLCNRRAMLELVKNIWIKGVLEQSLYKEVLIDLGMETRMNAIDHPWQMELRSFGNQDVVLPAGTKIYDVFRKANQALLILGEPGSGKTTMLLELARIALEEADQDTTEPIPVIFNLSSWADRKQPLEKWLIDELNKKYNIPRRVAQPWVEEDNLMLLLDGLDEIQVSARDDCVKALNDFRQKHGLVPLVVCSRVSDYNALVSRLNLLQAILLQPLTQVVASQYFAAIGEEHSPLYKLLNEDPALRDLAQSPLMLNIMFLAYRGMDREALQKINTVEERRQHILETYVNRMLSRPKRTEKYSKEKIHSWLSWLARNMVQHNQSVFLLEQLQPSWLNRSRHKWIYVFLSRIIGMEVLFVISVGVIYFIMGLLRVRLILIMFIPITIGALIMGALIAIFDGIMLRKKSTKFKKSRSVLILQSVSNILLVGFAFGISGAMILNGNLKTTIEVVFICILIFGLLYGNRRSLLTQTRDIRTYESVNFSFKKFLVGFVVFGVLIGCIIYTFCILMGRRSMYRYGSFPSVQLWDTAKYEAHGIEQRKLFRSDIRFNW